MVSRSPRRKASAFLLAALLAVGVLAAPADANPAVPYCPSGAELGVAGTSDPALCEQVTGRVFPEAFAHDDYGSDTVPATDFIGFPEFEAGIHYLAEQYPDRILVHELGRSVGLDGLMGTDTFPVYVVEVTDQQSPLPMDERQALLFMLSIHANEKGGREGGLRAIEDLAKGIGIGVETVQAGDGLPEPIPRPTGGDTETYQDYLQYMRLFFLFPNPDGWAHDEAPYFATEAALCGTLFCRSNGNGEDLNRLAPTMGWQNPSRPVVGEPEPIAYYDWLLTSGIEWSYGIDIHGMMNHQNFGAIMLPAGGMTAQEMHRSITLAESLKGRLNGDSHFDEWVALMATAEDVECTVQDCDADYGPVTSAVGSSIFAEYYTVIDALGYTDSGFNGDYFAQDTGLDAPGYDIEYAYNHITVDSQYEAGALWNDYHVQMTRHIVKAFMDAAALDVQVHFDTGGLRTLYVEPSFVATNLDDEEATPGGWADENPGDDLWDYGPDQPFFARPGKYWEDLVPFLHDGDAPGVLAGVVPDSVERETLDRYDTFVIPGSAIRDLEDDADAIATIRGWVEDGGTLVLTDEALRFLDLSGLTADAVDVSYRYMGGIQVDLEHPMLQKVRGGVKQMYEPTPLGFAEGADVAPNWYVDATAWTGLGGEVAGFECGTPNLGDDCSGNGIGLGRAAVGEGTVQIIGSLLPDPTEEFYHPYGLDHYATTYSGNQILRNMLGWDEVMSAPSIRIEDGRILQSANEPAVEAVGDEDVGRQTPMLGALAVLSLLGFIAVRRR